MQFENILGKKVTGVWIDEDHIGFDTDSGAYILSNTPREVPVYDALGKRTGFVHFIRSYFVSLRGVENLLLGDEVAFIKFEKSPFAYKTKSLLKIEAFNGEEVFHFEHTYEFIINHPLGEISTVLTVANEALWSLSLEDEAPHEMDPSGFTELSKDCKRYNLESGDFTGDWTIDLIDFDYVK